MKLGKIKIKHYINYAVIGIMTAVLAAIVLTGGRLDNSTLFLLEKMSISIILAVSLIGGFTFLLSAIGVKVGSLFGAKLEKKAQILGGVILICLGLKILIEDLLLG